MNGTADQTESYILTSFFLIIRRHDHRQINGTFFFHKRKWIRSIIFVWIFVTFFTLKPRNHWDRIPCRQAYNNKNLQTAKKKREISISLNYFEHLRSRSRHQGNNKFPQFYFLFLVSSLDLLTVIMKPRIRRIKA